MDSQSPERTTRDVNTGPGEKPPITRVLGPPIPLSFDEDERVPVEEDQVEEDQVEEDYYGMVLDDDNDYSDNDDDDDDDYFDGPAAPAA